MSSSNQPNALYPTSEPTWNTIANARQTERRRTIEAWGLRTLGKQVPLLPPPAVTNVLDWPIESGQLTTRQIEITESTPSQLLHDLETGVLSAKEVLLAFIARAVIAHYLTNPLSDPIFEEGLHRATELDEYRRKTGKTIGPLHGLPISLKDVMNVKGMATTLGFIALAGNRQPTSDELINRLFAAGAVFYCKTNVPQSLMSGECNNFLFGRTSSPHNTSLSAGGSSGGEGSLIALGGSPLGIGTDIAGSIRTPANFNGIYGFCPTYGRLPLHSADQSTAGFMIRGVAGPLCRTIDGLEVYTKTILSMKPWQWDQACENRPWDDKLYHETVRLGLNGKGALCIGFIANDGITTPHPPIQRGMHRVRAALQRFGVRVVDVSLLDGTEGIWDMAMKIFNADGGKSVRELVARSGEPLIEEISLASEADAMSAIELMSHGRSILMLRQKILKRLEDTISLTGTGRPVDMLVLPSGCHVAPPHGTMKYWLYEAISNVLDWPCATFPVGKVTAAQDPKPDASTEFQPLSEFDQLNWNLYSPEKYTDAPISLQLLGYRYQEEKVLAGLRVLEAALRFSAQNGEQLQPSL